MTAAWHRLAKAKRHERVNSENGMAAASLAKIMRNRGIERNGRQRSENGGIKVKQSEMAQWRRDVVGRGWQWRLTKISDCSIKNGKTAK